MERGSREIVLDSHTYDTVIFPPSKSFRILAWLGDILGESLGTALDGSKKSKNDLEINEAAMGKAVKALFSNIHRRGEDGRDGWDLICEVLSNTYVRGNERVALSPSLLDVHFAGRMGPLTKLVAFVLKENYADFLADALGQAQAAGLLPVKKPQSSNTDSTNSQPEAPSTGASGG